MCGLCLVLSTHSVVYHKVFLKLRVDNEKHACHVMDVRYKLEPIYSWEIHYIVSERCTPIINIPILPIAFLTFAEAKVGLAPPFVPRKHGYQHSQDITQHTWVIAQHPGHCATHRNTPKGQFFALNICPVETVSPILTRTRKRNTGETVSPILTRTRKRNIQTLKRPPYGRGLNMKKKTYLADE